MRLLGVHSPSFKELFTASKDAMKESYPELEEDFERILRTAVNEEEAFLRTLNAGLLVLDEEIAKANNSKAKSLSGDSVFVLHDTYGFPVDLTYEIAQEAGLEIDRDKFTSLMNIQRQRAKDDAKQKRSMNADLSVYGEFRALGETKFTGYQQLRSEAKVLGLIRDGQVVKTVAKGEAVEVILDETSFYAESGGQDSDSGLIVADGVVLEVLDVQKPVKGLVSHSVLVKEGQIHLGDKVATDVSPGWRLGAAQAHSATHVVHAALRQVLGPQALQSGSYNKPGYMRLDFSWSEQLSQSTKSEIEEITNLAIRQDLAVSAQYMTVQEAKDFGAVALFGETYDESVRVVQIGGPWSRELCGGTHVSRSSQVGLVSLIGEASVGSGSRRLEAYVGFEAFQHLAAERALVATLSESLKVPREQLIEKIGHTVEELRQAQKQLASLALDQLRALVPGIVKGARNLGPTKLVYENLGPIDSSEQLRELAVSVREKLEPDSAVVAIAGESAGKIVLIVATTKAARDAGIAAGHLVKEASQILGGGGGGKEDIAQGGGPIVSDLAKALSALERSITDK
jgi:alanyl-tRNA synthetase